MIFPHDIRQQYNAEVCEIVCLPPSKAPACWPRVEREIYTSFLVLRLLYMYGVWIRLECVRSKRRGGGHNTDTESNFSKLGVCRKEEKKPLAIFSACVLLSIAAQHSTSCYEVWYSSDLCYFCLPARLAPTHNHTHPRQLVHVQEDVLVRSHSVLDTNNVHFAVYDGATLTVEARKAINLNRNEVKKSSHANKCPLR